MPIVNLDPVALPPDTRLWHYMTFTKFMALLSTRQLFFPNIKTLAEADPFEGLFTRFELPARFLHVRPIRENHPFGDRAAREEHYEQVREKNAAENLWYYRQAQTTCFYASCWHKNIGESAGMWALYANFHEGIAITSTQARVEAAVKGPEGVPTHPADTVFSLPIDYEDFNDPLSDKYAAQHIPYPVHTKRKSYGHEQEYRLVFQQFNQISLLGSGFRMVGNSIDFNARVLDSDGDPLYVPEPYGKKARGYLKEQVDEANHRALRGIPVLLNLNKLIDEVWISPAAADWFSALVKSACQAYGLNVTPKKSPLLQVPSDPF